MRDNRTILAMKLVRGSKINASGRKLQSRESEGSTWENKMGEQTYWNTVPTLSLRPCHF